MGESMGATVALLWHRKKPTFWDGAVLVAPMCKIGDDVRPPVVVVNVLTKLCRIIPTWKIIPTQDIVDVAFRDPEVKQEIRSNPFCFKGRPCLLTGNQLLTISLDLEQILQEVSIPFLIVHGADDKGCDIPSPTENYRKTMTLFLKMLQLGWMTELPRESQLEHEQKLENDDLLKGKSGIETV